ncbi:MAG: hypothetical protein EOP51_28170 [Sphingobacteriales bacterium]|nr:MAG: hypothetical protein EOP51_28170 [Sphingobacteriales bacterium]
MPRIAQKTILFFLLMTVSAYNAMAQKESDVYNRFLDMNVSILDGKPDEALVIAESILPDIAGLPAKTRVSFYNMTAKLYEDNDTKKSINLYLKVAAAVPNYYVAHRALGYLYLNEAEEIEKKDGLSSDSYINTAKNALPHLEKAQACDPSPETLEVITSIYKKIKDDAGLKSLNSRLKKLSVNCEDILEAE